MSEVKTAEQRLNDLEKVVRTLIAFNINTASVLGRRLSAGNPAIANAIVQDLEELKSSSNPHIDVGLHNSHIDSLIEGIIGK
ncbi:hypothetical protein [Pseudomonas tolaasii]|uniref:hypothetical protein n=1 Tax=Pseudomonas tolaasii TaxID=29442 RepID=UPI0002D9DEB3|nr:hypothetical protein [Pseudomonas tolaasii]